MDGNGSRLTLLNNWEATYFDFDQEKPITAKSGWHDFSLTSLMQFS
jgi:alpha-galactosidase